VIELIATLKHFGNQALGFRVQLGTTSAKAKNPGQCFFFFFFGFFWLFLLIF
jgi:hypothetical protein